jgi:hypothetical protein
MKGDLPVSAVIRIVSVFPRCLVSGFLLLVALEHFCVLQVEVFEVAAALVGGRDGERVVRGDVWA